MCKLKGGYEVTVSIPLCSVSLGSVAGMLAFALTAAGCATSAPTVPAGQAGDAGNVSGVRGETEAEPAVAADFEKAMKHLAAGEYDKGVDLLREVAQRSPGHTAPYINLAMAYEKIGEMPAAEESIKKALALDPSHPVANTTYGLLCRKTGRFAEARQVYERTLKQFPDYVLARKDLGILCDVYLRDVECALTQYQAYSAARPDDKTVQVWIADLEQRRTQKAH